MFTCIFMWFMYKVFEKANFFMQIICSYFELPYIVLHLQLFDFPQRFFLAQLFSPLNTIWHSLPASRWGITCRLFAFFFCNTIWCVSQTTKGNRGWQERRREGRMKRMGAWSSAQYLRQSNSFFVVCSPCGRKASHLLHHHQSMTRTALTTHLYTKASW